MSRSDVKPDDAIFAVNNRMFFRLMQCSNLYDRKMMQEINHTSIQGAVLGAISQKDGGMSFSSLVDYLAVSRQNLHAVLKRLERSGYVRREESTTDRRARLAKITPEGLRYWKESHARSAEFFERITVGVTLDEKRALTDALITIARNLRE